MARHYKKLTYIVHKLHFIVENKLTSVTSRFRYLERPVNSTAVASDLTDLIESFELKNKLTFAVTDLGGNLVNACEKIGLKRFNCLAHLIHLLISVDLAKIDKEYDKKIKKCRSIYTKLKYKQDLLNDFKLNEIQYYLDNHDEEIQLDLRFEYYENIDHDYSIPEIINDPGKITTLKRDVITRWYSQLPMFKSIIENKIGINSLLSNCDNQEAAKLILDNDDLEILQCYIHFLTEIERVTKLLFSEKSPTMIYF